LLMGLEMMILICFDELVG